VSLRSRLLGAVGVVTFVALLASGIATYSLLQSYLYDRVDRTLDASSARLTFALNNGEVVTQCATPNGQGGPGGAGDGGPGRPGQANAFQIAFFEVRTAGGQVVAGQQCPAYVGGKSFSPALPTMIGGLSGSGPGSVTYFTTGATSSSGPRFRVRAAVLEDGTELVLAVPLTDADATLHDLLAVELAVAAVALLAAIAGGFVLVRLGLKPLTTVERTAAAITAGDLSERVPGATDRSEVGRVATALNTMLDRISEAFAERDEQEATLRRFVADASHELRTPIAAVSAYAELFERGARGRPEDLDRVLRGISTESARMQQLVDDLLTLARLDEGIEQEMESVELVTVAAEAIQTAAAVGPDHQVILVARTPVEVRGDASQLRRVLDNLLGNVRAHTPAGTTATVTVTAADSVATVAVRDDGPGMPEADALHAFDRFYRADLARGRSSGGTGLGLSIVAAIVARHGGTVAMESAPGAGTTVTITLPVDTRSPETST